MPENSFTEEKVKILKEQFRKNEYIRGEKLMRQLVKATGLRADQIRTWFSRERGKRKRGEEKDELEKKIADKDAEIRGLRDQIAALQVQNAAETAALQDDEITRLLEQQTFWQQINSDMDLGSELQQQTPLGQQSSLQLEHQGAFNGVFPGN